MLPRWSRAALAALTLAALGACDDEDDDDLQARERYELPGDSVFPEGIGTDPDGRAFYVGSTADGTIYRAGLEDGTAEVFLPGGADGRTDVRGIKVADKGRLYAAGGGTGQVHVYDTGSRALLARRVSDVASFVNDLAITPSGDVYATDSREPVIYRIPADASGQGALERWLPLAGTPITFTPALPAQGDFDLNGIVSTADGTYLLTVQTSTGRLYRIRVADRTVSEVDLGAATLPGDGLLLEGRTLWAVTRQGTVGSVVRLQLSEDFGSATVESTTGNPGFDFPTTLARAGDRLLVVNSQLNRRNPPQPPTLPFTIIGIPVP